MDALTDATLNSLAKETLPKLLNQLTALLKAAAAQRTPSPETAALVDEAIELLGLLKPWFATTTNQGSTESISDEDALALLREMDAPVEASTASPESSALDSVAAEINAEMAAESSNPAGSTDMSDDEAFKLLQEMDAPAPPITTEVKGVYVNPTNANPPANQSGGSDVDDETARMMAELEAQASGSGSIEDTVAAPAQNVNVIASAPSIVHESADSDVEDPGEINEWDENQFSSDPEMLKDFMTNSSDLMEQLDATILQLEQDPTNKETIEAIFRAAHTLKGAAGMFGYRAIERVMHRMENLFDLVRKGKLVPNADTIDVVFQGLDVLRKLLEAVSTGQKSGMLTAPIVKALELAAKGRAAKVSTTASGSSAQANPLANKPAAAQQPNIVANGSLNQPVIKPQVSNQPAATQAGNGGGNNNRKKEEQSTIRVDLERLDALVNLVGELVIDRTRFAAIEEELRTTAPQLKAGSNMTETVQLFGRHMNEIQDIIMKVRMVPIGNAFNKFPRVVRDLARQLGKQIDLLIDGETTELDKTLVEQIGDPLVHLIRNACDHGIESPAERTKSGKPATGRVVLAAKQEGNHIVISISDDGKGMNVEKIRAKGIERGLISADANLSDREIFNLIFESGFSTAEQVTTVSGRGVGMDVVRKQIAKLKGMVEINSTFGKGSTITIQLPLTLAIVQSLLVNCKGDTFAIPLSAVVESMRIEPKEIQKVGDTEVIKIRNHVMPIIHLDQALELNRKDSASWYTGYNGMNSSRTQTTDRRRKADRFFVVVVGSANHRYGIIVDQLLTQQEMVIKPMGPAMRGTPCVAGGAVLGNGEVVLVMDIQDLIENYRQKNRQAVA